MIRCTLSLSSDLSVGAINSRRAPGTILLGAGHTISKACNGCWLSCNIDERGMIAGGLAGEHKPGETGFRPLFARAGGWPHVITPPAEPATAKRQAAPASTGTLKVGSRGSQMKALQAGLTGTFPKYVCLDVHVLRCHGR